MLTNPNNQTQVSNSRNLYLVDSIIKKLFEPEIKKFQSDTVELVKANARAGGGKDGFYFQGAFFSDLEVRSRKGAIKGKLLDEFIPSMKLLISGSQTILKERDEIKQILALMVKDCHTSQHLRDTLPNCLKDSHEKLSSLDRIQEEAWTIKDNPDYYKTYLELKPKIEYYSVTKFLY